MTTDHRDGIHDPRHGLLIRVDVRRGNVAIWPNDRRDFKSVATSKPLEFVSRKTLRITNNSALTTAIRNANCRTLPGHPRGQCFHFIEADVWVITNTSLGWPTRNVVLDAITLKHLHVAPIHLYRDGDDQLALGILEYMPHGRVEVEVIGGTVELLFGDCERIEFFLNGLLGRHAVSPRIEVTESEVIVRVGRGCFKVGERSICHDK